jgi:hypothetical protein
MNDKTTEALEQDIRAVADYLEHCTELEPDSAVAGAFDRIRRSLEDKGEREQGYDDLVDVLDEVLDAPDCTGRGCDSYGHDEDCEISDVGKHALMARAKV